MNTDPVTRLGAATFGRRRLLQGGAILAGAAALAACSDDDKAAEPESEADALGFYPDALIVGPLVKPTLTWTDHNGQPYNIAEQTEGRTTLLFFGYTSCPDQCPVYLNNISAVLDKMSGPAKAINVLFVGVDTERDTIDVMKPYLESKNRDFLGLTATPDEIDATLASLLLPGVTYPNGKTGNYTVGHPLQCVVFTKDNLCHIMYPYDLLWSEWDSQLTKLDTFTWPTESAS